MDQGKSQQVTIVLRVLRSYDAEAGGALRRIYEVIWYISYISS